METWRFRFGAFYELNYIPEGLKENVKYRLNQTESADVVGISSWSVNSAYAHMLTPTEISSGWTSCLQAHVCKPCMSKGECQCMLEQCGVAVV